jgi:hypothetical protein
MPVLARLQLPQLLSCCCGCAGEAGVIPMKMESVEAMEFISEKVNPPSTYHIII